MADIFLSYSSDDRDRVAPLVAHLVSAGYSVWWDKKIHGGTMFSKEIEAELKAAKVVLVVWSPSSIESRWVADEVELGLNTGKLVPITLDGTPPPMGFRQIQTIDFSEWQDGTDNECLGTLLSTLAHHTGAAQVETKTTKDASIAVLPFVNMSADPEQEYFSDGLSEELLNLLAKIDKMRVSARTSSFKFKGKDVDIFEVGKALNVAHVLEGSVRKAGNRIRITAQLIETKDGFHLWSETYDRELDDIFAIQDEISAAIVVALKEEILGDQIAPQTEKTSNFEAYEIYLHAQQSFDKDKNVATAKKALSDYERALELDPNFVPALTEVARLHHLLSNDVGCFGTTPAEIARKRSMPYIKRALELAPNHPNAHVGMASNLMKGRRLDEAEAEIDKALSINANSTNALTTLLFIKLLRADPLDRTTSLVRKIRDLDPLNTNALGNLSTHLVEYAKFEEAQQIVDKIVMLEPGTNGTLFRQMELHDTQGHFAECLQTVVENHAALKKGPTILAYSPTLFAFGLGSEVENLNARMACVHYISLGQPDDAKRAAELVESSPDEHDNYRRDLSLSLYQAAAGNDTKALSLLSPYDEEDPDKWGPHFSTEELLLGAQLAAYLRKQLGDETGAAFYLAKLKTAFDVQLNDPDGVTFYTYSLGACTAALEGDIDTALNLVEKHLDQTLIGSLGFKGLPWFDSLRSEPRFQTVIAQVDAHLDGERLKAKEMGILPLPKDFATLLKDFKAETTN